MLYEVITERVIVRRRQQAGGERRARPTRFDLALDQRVITSYSIHYTKLYEGVIEIEVPHGAAFPGNDAAVFSSRPFVGHGVCGCRARITSYNVCYTKLLRDERKR